MSSVPARPAKRARDRHRADVVLLHVDPAVRRGVRVEAHRAHLVPERRPVEQHPEDDDGRKRDEDADVQTLEALRAPEVRQPRAERHLLRLRRFAGSGTWRGPPTPDEPRRDPEGDPVEHDRRDHLVGADGGLEDAGDPRVCSRRRASPPRCRGGCAGHGFSPAKSTPSQLATMRPTMYWPLPPMLNIPQRNAKATARPVRMSGVVCRSVCEMLYAANVRRGPWSDGRASSARCRRRSP